MSADVWGVCLSHDYVDRYCTYYSANPVPRLLCRPIPQSVSQQPLLGENPAEMIKDLLWPEVNPCPLGVKRQDVKISHLGTSDTSVHQKKNNKLSIMTTGSCPPDETSLGVGQVQSYLQITTAWLGLTIPTPSGKQCQGRGSQDDDDYTSNIFILEAPLNRKTTMGNVMNPPEAWLQQTP